MGEYGMSLEKATWGIALETVGALRESWARRNGHKLATHSRYEEMMRKAKRRIRSEILKDYYVK